MRSKNDKPVSDDFIGSSTLQQRYQEKCGGTPDTYNPVIKYEEPDLIAMGYGHAMFEIPLPLGIPVDAFHLMLEGANRAWEEMAEDYFSPVVDPNDEPF